MVDKIIEKITGMKGIVVTIGIGVGQGKELIRNYGNNRDRSSSNNRSRSGSRASTNRDRIRCYACRKYEHFVRDCPNSREEREI